jgi:hypothetical protein
MQGEPDRDKRAVFVLRVEMGLQRVRKEVHVDAIKKATNPLLRFHFPEAERFVVDGERE